MLCAGSRTGMTMVGVKLASGADRIVLMDGRIMDSSESSRTPKHERTRKFLSQIL